jgi:hypothetical protein
MSEPMQASYHISERDYVRAGALFGRPSKRFWVVAAVFLVAGLAVAMWGARDVRWVALGGVIGGVLGGLFVPKVVNPWLLRRHYRRYKAAHDEQRVSLSDDGLQFATVDAAGRVPWAKILKWRFNADYVLVYPMPRLYYIIPTSLAEQGFDIEQLKAELTRHVGPAQ